MRSHTGCSLSMIEYCGTRFGQKDLLVAKGFWVWCLGCCGQSIWQHLVRQDFLVDPWDDLGYDQVCAFSFWAPFGLAANRLWRRIALSFDVVYAPYSMPLGLGNAELWFLVYIFNYSSLSMEIKSLLHHQPVSVIDVTSSPERKGPMG